MNRISLPALINNYIFRHLKLKIEKVDRTFEHKRSRLIFDLKPDIVIDGGANIGQWALELHKAHPQLEVWSFEPLEKSRKLLELQASKRSSVWKVFPFAIGKEEGKKRLNIASNEQMSSSFLNPSFHTRLRPDILFDDTEEVSVVTLDSIRQDLIRFESIFLKLDIQGSELDAILGGLRILDKVSMIEIESSFTPLYEGETAHHELISSIKALGFTPWFINVPSSDSSGRQFALDTILVRNNLIPRIYF